jgi:exosortase/archaeosortase family protein
VQRRDELAGPVPAGLRLATAIVAVALAYRFSLATLATDWRYDTPLADLVLVPPIAAALLFAALRRHRFVVFLRLGRFDYVLAGALGGIALALVAAGPTLWSKYFWAMRIDLLTLPLFAAAIVVLLFGSRALIPLGFPLLFLALAWPLPYDALLEHALSSFTQSTAWAVERLASVTHVATAVIGSDNSRYVVAHGSDSIVVSVASACSGVNGLVGFGVVGIAALWLVRGRLVRRFAWLVFGAALVWALNVARIVVVLLTARRLGEHAAFDLLHPVAGIVALNIAFLVLVRLLPLFGLRRRHFDEHDLELVDSPLARTATPAQQATPRRFAVRFAAVAAATVAFALADGQLGAAAKGLDESGRPAVAAFVDRPAAGRGWTVRRVERISWAAPYYGRHSSWVRYRLRPVGSVARRGAFTVWTDAVLSPDLGALDAFSLAHCYAFHGFRVRTSLHVDLGDGVVGRVFVYETRESVWHAVAWEWPVLRDGKVEHERIVLLASTTSRPGALIGAQPRWLRRRVLGYLNANARDDDPNPQLSHALVALAAQMVSTRVTKGVPA